MPSPPPYAYVLTADAPAPGHLAARYQLAVGAAGDGAIRFVDPAIRSDGLVHQLGAEAGLLPGLSLGGYGLMDTTPKEAVRASAGGWVQGTLAPAEDGPRVAGRVGVLRELDGVAAVSGWVIGGVRAGPVDATVDLQVERRLTEGADPVDLVLPVGASAAVYDGLRVGAEYVGQDLEEYGDPEDEGAEGGPVHVAAFTLGASFLDHALQVAVAPGYAVSVDARGFVARASAVWQF